MSMKSQHLQMNAFVGRKATFVDEWYFFAELAQIAHASLKAPHCLPAVHKASVLSLHVQTLARIKSKPVQTFARSNSKPVLTDLAHAAALVH
jgi:hypothetical protein